MCCVNGGRADAADSKQSERDGSHGDVWYAVRGSDGRGVPRLWSSFDSELG